MDPTNPYVLRCQPASIGAPAALAHTPQGDGPDSTHGARFLCDHPFWYGESKMKHHFMGPAALTWPCVSGPANHPCREGYGRQGIQTASIRFLRQRITVAHIRSFDHGQHYFLPRAFAMYEMMFAIVIVPKWCCNVGDCLPASTKGACSPIVLTLNGPFCNCISIDLIALQEMRESRLSFSMGEGQKEALPFALPHGQPIKTGTLP